MFSSVIEFLFGLQNIRMADVGRTHFAFQMQNIWWALPAVAALAILGYVSYHHVPATRGRRISAALLRGTILALLLILFLRPSLVLDRQTLTRSVIAVWVDNSLSMTLRDPYSRDAKMQMLLKQIAVSAARKEKLTRYELAEGISGEEWLKKLSPQQDIALFTGAINAQPVGVAHNQEELAALIQKLPSYAPGSGGENTDVPAVVREMLMRLRGQPVSAVVMFTDGRSTIPARIDSAVDEARQASVQVYAIPVGQSDLPLNIKLADIHAPENAFSKDPVAVRATLEATGLPGSVPVKVTLKRRDTGESLAEKTINTPADGQPTPVELSFKPAGKEGNVDHMELILHAEPATPVGEELTLEDNTLTMSLNVVDTKITALYVEGAPRWEYRYLKNELIREKTVDVSVLLLSADEDFAQEGDVAITRFPETEEELNKYDILILGDVDPNYFSPAQQQLLIKWVRNRAGGICFLAGRRYNPNSYRGTPLDVLLPIVPDDAASPVLPNSDGSGFRPQPTASGMAGNLFRFFDDQEMNQRQMQENPELFWYRPTMGLKGSAEVLAVHPARSQGGQPLPLIVDGHYGAGRTLFLGIADTWRWRRYKGEPLYQTFWLQICRLLYADKAFGQARPIEIVAESPQVELGQPIRIIATIRDVTQAAVMPQRLQLEVQDDAGKPAEMITLNRTGDTSYQGMITAIRTGTFNAKLRPGALNLELPPIRYSVITPRRETTDITADYSTLNNIANGTGGKLLRPYEANQLATLIPNRSIQTYVPMIEELWHSPLALIVLFILLSAEWFVRKNASLP